MKTLDITDFAFQRKGYGCYLVTYTTKRGDYWLKTVTYMPIVDATLYAEEPKQKDLVALRKHVKQGSHYSKSNKCLDY